MAVDPVSENLTSKYKLGRDVLQSQGVGEGHPKEVRDDENDGTREHGTANLESEEPTESFQLSSMSLDALQADAPQRDPDVNEGAETQGSGRDVLLPQVGEDFPMEAVEDDGNEDQGTASHEFEEPTVSFQFSSMSLDAVQADAPQRDPEVHEGAETQGSGRDVLLPQVGEDFPMDADEDDGNEDQGTARHESEEPTASILSPSRIHNTLQTDAQQQSLEDEEDEADTVRSPSRSHGSQAGEWDKDDEMGVERSHHSQAEDLAEAESKKMDVDAITLASKSSTKNPRSNIPRVKLVLPQLPDTPSKNRLGKRKISRDPHPSARKKRKDEYNLSERPRLGSFYDPIDVDALQVSPKNLYLHACL